MAQQQSRAMQIALRMVSDNLPWPDAIQPSLKSILAALSPSLREYLETLGETALGGDDANLRSVSVEVATKLETRAETPARGKVKLRSIGTVASESRASAAAAATESAGLASLRGPFEGTPFEPTDRRELREARGRGAAGAAARKTPLAPPSGTGGVRLRMGTPAPRDVTDLITTGRELVPYKQPGGPLARTPTIDVAVEDAPGRARGSQRVGKAAAGSAEQLLLTGHVPTPPETGAKGWLKKHGGKLGKAAGGAFALITALQIAGSRSQAQQIKELEVPSARELLGQMRERELMASRQARVQQQDPEMYANLVDMLTGAEEPPPLARGQFIVGRQPDQGSPPTDVEIQQAIATLGG